MTTTIFSSCTPRADVLNGTIAEADFAADLAKVIRGVAHEDYQVPARFFANTYPTAGLKNLLRQVMGRLTGKGESSAAIFRLDTSYGGGKTHSLIALTHVAAGMPGVKNSGEFLESKLIPSGKVRIAAFDGENADPANGRAMGEGVLAFTPWGEIAYALAGKVGYERLRKSDESHTAPGAETIAELFGQEPSLILLDELSIYLRKVANIPGARDQLSAFLTSLFKAVESNPHVALVYTLAIGKDGKAGDAYSGENQFISDRMAEAESISARKATLLNPTEDDETVQVILRRLFERIDTAAAGPVIEAYRAAWQQHKDSIPAESNHPETLKAFQASYPLHPELLETLTTKTATLANFQRVRGMLRLLARTVQQLWATKPDDATAIHVHHVDLGMSAIRDEIFTKLGRSEFKPAVSHDIAGGTGTPPLAQQIDTKAYKGLAPYCTYVARTIFLHTLAFNEQLKGITAERLRFSALSPTLDLGFVEDARKQFQSLSAYLDDRPGVPLRFLAEANLTQIVRREEEHVDKATAREELRDRIRTIFAGSVTGAIFELVPFPAGPWDVADDAGDGRPRLVLLSHEALTVGATVEAVPDLIARIFDRRGSDGGSLRILRNHLVFLTADETRLEEMRRAMMRRLALRELIKPGRIQELAEHQQAKVRELETKSDLEVATVIQQAYRHVFYPSRQRLAGSPVDLNHAAIDIHSASERPGTGQQQVIRALRDNANQKLRLAEDAPESPGYIRDRTPLKKGQISTAALRDEFRKDPALSIHSSDNVLIRAINQGINQGDYVYRSGDLLCGPGDPLPSVKIDENSFVFTIQFAKEKGMWPRPAPAAATPAGAGASVAPGASPVGAGTGSGSSGQPLSVGGGASTFSGGSASGVAEPTPPPPGAVTAEGPLKQALGELWEKCRKAKLTEIKVLSLRLFDATDAFKMLGSLNAEKNCKKTVTLSGAYETASGGEMELTFRGSPDDALPVKDFLVPQLNAAAAAKKERNVDATFELIFDPLLSLAGDAPEKLAERLGKFASGAAYVAATAQG